MEKLLQIPSDYWCRFIMDHWQQIFRWLTPTLCYTRLISIEFNFITTKQGNDCMFWFCYPHGTQLGLFPLILFLFFFLCFNWKVLAVLSFEFVEQFEVACKLDCKCWVTLTRFFFYIIKMLTNEWKFDETHSWRKIFNRPSSSNVFGCFIHFSTDNKSFICLPLH